MAEHIKNILEQFIGRKYKEVVEVKKVEDIIKENITKVEEKHLCGIKINKKTITLYTDSSCGAYQIKLEKNNILKNIQKVKPDIENIFIKVGER